MTQALAVRYGADGIRSNVVAPGVIKTDMTRDYWDTGGFQRTNHDMTPFNRDGTVEEVANAVYFLALPEGSYINGQTIALDGGWSTTKFLAYEALTGALTTFGPDRADWRMDFDWTPEQLPADWEMQAHGPADDLQVPASAMLGAEGQAWEIARTAPSLERVGIPRFALAARAPPATARLASHKIIATAPEASAARYATVMAERLVGEFMVEHMPESLAGAEPLLQAHHQRAIVAGIASGAAEIQLNLIATELLKLPREPR